jgi:hypothetical protein
VTFRDKEKMNKGGKYMGGLIGALCMLIRSVKVLSVNLYTNSREREFVPSYGPVHSVQNMAIHDKY